VVDSGDRSIALFRLRDRVHAYLNVCPHRGGPVGEGPIVDGIVMCPWHGWKFDVATGELRNNPQVRLHEVPVRIEGGDVVIELSADSPSSDCA
jgi:nitrite reductase/ring-hydroxylating ferredoxin subunit